MDLVSYVEFHNNFKAVQKHHAAALKATRDFWRELMKKDIAFQTVTDLVGRASTATHMASSVFRSMLRQHPNNVKLLRAHGHFLREVANDPWRALKQFELADRIEDAQAQVCPSLPLHSHALGPLALGNLWRELTAAKVAEVPQGPPPPTCPPCDRPVPHISPQARREKLLQEMVGAGENALSNRRSSMGHKSEAGSGPIGRAFSMNSGAGRSSIDRSKAGEEWEGDEIDDTRDAVIAINENGIVVMTNRLLNHMFG